MNTDAMCPHAQHPQHSVHAMTIKSAFELKSHLQFPSFPAFLCPDTQGWEGSAGCRKELGSTPSLPAMCYPGIPTARGISSWPDPQTLKPFYLEETALNRELSSRWKEQKASFPEKVQGSPVS